MYKIIDTKHTRDAARRYWLLDDRNTVVGSEPDLEAVMDLAREHGQERVQMLLQGHADFVVMTEPQK